MARLGIDKDFLLDFARLDKPVQQKVSATFAKFQEATHAGLHLEKIDNARDDRLRTIRIDRFWRGVVLAPDRGDHYTLLKVLPHEEAYAWAQRRRVSVNSATGRIEIRDSVALDSTLPELDRSARRGRGETRPLFAGVDATTLRRLGVDEQTLAFARAVTDLAQLETAQAFLPESQWTVLYGLAAGMSPDDVWQEIAAAVLTVSGPDEPVSPATVGAGAFDPDDVAAAVERSQDRVVLVSGPAELLEVLNHPFDLWRVYLHPIQFKVANARYRGPARVTGGPGTGKTVVALHRARHLAAAGEGPVLLTTFTGTLTATLQTNLALLEAEAAIRDRVAVRTVDQVANQIWRSVHGAPPPLIQGDEERDLWKEIIDAHGLAFGDRFVADEWRQVILGNGITDLAGYQAASRGGRGKPLTAAQRGRVWAAVEAFEARLREQGVLTHALVCAEATRLLEQGAVAPDLFGPHPASAGRRPFRHVVVDEAQDLSPAQWRLLRAVVAPAENDLFLAGDAHQRIYGHRASLRDHGIVVTGRASRLTVNYRTTAEILAWSLGVLRDERIDDLDGGLDSIAGYRSELHGRRPVLAGAPTPSDEAKGLVEVVRGWIDAGVEPAEIGVAARTNAVVEETLTALLDAGLPARSLAKPKPRGRKVGTGSQVAVGSMHRMKGLEFRCLAVTGVGAGQVPSSAVTPADEDPYAHALDLQRERCVLFVACTRAREQLYVSWHGVPSPFLAAVR
ncbi:DEAD/DEAH box helicase [Frankia sp. AgB1.9]|uniref:UvrD-helicase domain-containing protein n=1 Tax=unclassified Frankia TaxID=2632575 RepID=UPI0019322E37|nr:MULTISPECIES: UvrD-helicase domain-containing protein [unclassified Frankia]MBL7494138.1 DEAD/DEAH box helicase [Frankia sp. AgW1.1]MBL7548905.1 DEAD/DEAH box helicase [Frankia sp. AgB1.9]MBL7625210.1 DEAD/DEAH box helicase [Frankia sp. AgB1.8]